MIESIFRAGKYCYPQEFLEECKYIVKEKKMPPMIFSNDSDRKNSDEGNSDEENYDEKNSDEEN